MIMISKDVIGIYAGGLRSYARGGRIAAGGGLFASGPFAAGRIKLLPSVPYQRNTALCI